MAKNTTMKASSLKHLLIFLISLIVILGIAGSVFAIKIVDQRANEVVHSQIDAKVSEGSAGHLNELQSYLDANSGLIDFTSHYVSSTSGAQSQDTIIAALNAVARKAGVSIQNFDFSAAAAPSAPSTTPSSSGLAFNVTLKVPLSYASFLRFLQGMEKDAPRLQITSTKITPDTVNPNTITVDPLLMKVIQ